MKKVLLLCLILLPLLSIAQSIDTIPKLELKNVGFVDSQDSTKKYVVISAPGLSKQDLYKSILVYLNSIYKDPKRVLTTVENESITINALTESIKGSLDWYVYRLYYNINIQFKDERFRIVANIEDLKEHWADNKPPRKIYVSDSDSSNPHEINTIWLKTKKGESVVFKDDLKESVDNWINSFVFMINESLKNGDW